MAGGRSVEETAHLAGMETSEWLAIEAGHVPETSAKLRPMADALECGFERIANLARLCRGAWEIATCPPPPRTFRGTGGQYSNPYTHLQRKEVSAIKRRK